MSLEGLGRVIGVRWEGEDFGLGIVKHLSENVLVTKAVLESHSDYTSPYQTFEIHAYPDRGCWILTVGYVLAPSRQEWECYQSIASHLLAMPLPPNT